MVTQKSAIDIAKNFVSECIHSGLNFQKVFLFGSYAKGNFDEWSDIDLVLVSDQFKDNIFDDIKLYSKINIKYPKIETHPFSPYEFKNQQEYINEISKHKIEIL